MGKVGLYVYQSCTQGCMSKGVRASYFGRPYCAVKLKLSGFRCKVYSVSERYMGIGFGYKVGFDWFMCSSMGWFVYVKGMGVCIRLGCRV